MTLTELLIAVTLIGLVFAGAASMYVSALKFLKVLQEAEIAPDIAFEPVTRKIALANSAVIPTGGGPQNSRLDIRVDQTCAGAPLRSPSNTGDDSRWHYRFTSSSLLALCDGLSGTVPIAVGQPPGTISLMSNLDTSDGSSRSRFDLLNPSGQGNPIVVKSHIVSTNPVMTFDREIATGAQAK